MSCWYSVSSLICSTTNSTSQSHPEQFRVNTAEVYLKKTPEGFLVFDRDPWEIFFEGVEELSPDFMTAGRRQPRRQKRTWK